MAHADRGGYQAGSLSPEQMERVDALLTIDSAIHGIALGSVGEWMLKPNAACVQGLPALEQL